MLRSEVGIIFPLSTPLFIAWAGDILLFI